MSDLPPKNHNQPPKPVVPSVDEIKLHLDNEHTALAKRRDEIAAGWMKFLTANPVITTRDVQAKASDFLDIMRKYIGACERAHESEKEPYLLGGKAVDGHFNSLMYSQHEDAKLPIGSPQPKKGSPPAPSIMVKLRQMMTAAGLLFEEEERAAARADAQRAADEAAALLAEAEKTMEPEALEKAAVVAEVAEKAEVVSAAPASSFSRVHGEFGSVASLRTSWQFDESASDLMALAKAVVEGREPLHYLAFNSTRIGTAVRSDKVRAIEGCVIAERKSI